MAIVLHPSRSRARIVPFLFTRYEPNWTVGRMSSQETSNRYIHVAMEQLYGLREDNSIGAHRMLLTPMSSIWVRWSVGGKRY